MQHNNSKGQLTAQIDLGNHVKSGFDMSYSHDGSARIGRIMNTRCMFVQPADTFEGKSIAALQFEPLAVPTLNNMHVKQEHFYVPFNVVWENFDDFISGGEDMNYNGKVPSKSLRDMFVAFSDILQNDFANPLLSIPVSIVVRGIVGTENVSYQFGISRTEIEDSFLNYSFPTELREYLDSLQMLDLFDHIEPIIKECGKYMLAQIDAGYKFEYNSEEYLTVFVPSNEEDVSLMWDTTNPNKYLSLISKAVVNAFELNVSSTIGKDFAPIPTSAFMEVLRYSYEIVKPFLGLGSYLDSMNYNKFTYADWVYLFVVSFGLTNVPTENISNLLTIRSVFISNFPQSILPLRAQYCVWWNNYRDQLLETNALRPVKTDAISDVELFVLLAPRLRCWHKDTFTTSLDSAGTVNGVVPTSNQGTHDSLTMKWRDVIGQASEEAIKNDKTVYEIRFSANEVFKIPSGYISGMHDAVQNKSNTTTSYFSLDMLDAAKRAQKWLRKSVFFGNRIQDFLKTRFGVDFLDARLRLPELLSTSSKLVQLTDVINPTTIATNESSTVAGDRAAIAHAFDEKGGYFKRYCEEHGVIISNLTVMPDVSYVNGFARELSQLDQFDFPFEEFATLGLDAVYNVELVQLPVMVYNQDKQNFDATPEVFGYQGRYYNYKAHHNEAHGELLDTQDMYLFARKFNIYDPDSMPKLNYIFVHCHPFLGMFVVDNEYSDYYRYNILHSYTADRLLPVHSLYM